MRFKIEIEYDGTGFSGWQLQDNAVTVQGELEKALAAVFNRNIRVHGAGRTDAGVHARGQVAHFDLPAEKEITEYKILSALNALTSPAIAVKKVERAPDDFHARFSAIARRYRYYISSCPVSIQRNFVWFLPVELDDDKIIEFCQYIEEKEDFQSFAKHTESLKHYLCDIHFVRWFRNEDGLNIFEIEANRFLHGMVRALVGTAVAVGKNKMKLSELEEIFRGRDRRLAPMAAPAKGLILEEVKYQ